MSGLSWLMAVDLQQVFAEPSSPWCTPRFADALAGTLRLRGAFGGRVALTRFRPPDRPTGAWGPYYAAWPFALDPANLPLYELVPDLPVAGAVVLDRPTFGKWDAATAAALPGVTEMVLTGVSTDCCVLSTALAAADAGVHVRVVVDACAGASEDDHRRALDAMALYAPLIDLTTVDEVLARR